MAALAMKRRARTLNCIVIYWRWGGQKKKVEMTCQNLNADGEDKKEMERRVLRGFYRRCVRYDGHLLHDIPNTIFSEYCRLTAFSGAASRELAPTQNQQHRTVLSMLVPPTHNLCFLSTSIGTTVVLCPDATACWVLRAK